MRYVKVPKDAEFKDRPKLPDGQFQGISFRNWVVVELATDKRWFSTTDWEDAADAVWTAFDDAKEGSVAELSDKAYEKLEQVTRETQFAADIKPALRWFVRAITQADKLDPRTPKPVS